MAEQSQLGVGVGVEDPGSRLMAAVLLEMLTLRSRFGDRARAARVAGLEGDDLVDAPRWLDPDAFGRMLSAASIDGRVARSLGHRMLRPEAMGMPLYALGLATPEKAYRRLHALLPREAREASWTTDRIDGESAWLSYHPHSGAAATASTFPVQTASCAVRRGMLEAIPTLYGLLPARVRHDACVARGADRCRYQVEWQRSPSRKMLVGGALGVLIGTVATGAAWGLGAIPLAFALPGVGAIAGLGAALGRALDLADQLEAVAGARRGQLALYDQVDDLLASKLDALARADAKLEADPAPQRARVRRGLGSTNDESLVDADADDVAADRSAREDRPVDLEALVAHAIVSVRPLLHAAATIHVDAEDGLEPVSCDAIQIEKVLVQLLSNAIEASQGLSAEPEAWVTLRRVRMGIEIAVEDHGVGIDSSAVDEAFDPFFGDAPADDLRGLGLPGCLGIIEAHGGELRIESEDRPGTRVSILLPRDGRGAARGHARKTRDRR